MTEDKFDRSRELVWGTPGFLSRRSTVIAPGSSLIPQASWIIETVKNDDGYTIFLQAVSADGGQRIVLPGRVANTIFGHFRQLSMKARSARAKRGAETRRAKAVKEAETIIEAGNAA